MNWQRLAGTADNLFKPANISLSILRQYNIALHNKGVDAIHLGFKVNPEQSQNSWNNQQISRLKFKQLR